jgi:hypothetical protein
MIASNNPAFFRVQTGFYDLYRLVSTQSGSQTFAGTIYQGTRKVDRQGTMLPLTDIAIASCAFRTGATLITAITADEHFSGGSRSIRRLDIAASGMKSAMAQNYRRRLWH